MTSKSNTSSVPTEAEWEESERIRLGLTKEQWADLTVDEDWDNRRPVIVMWGDPLETPTQRLARFDEERREALDARAQERRRHNNTIRAVLPAHTAHLIEQARDLIGVGMGDEPVENDEYTRAMVELISQSTEPIPGLSDYMEVRDFVEAELKRLEGAED